MTVSIPTFPLDQDGGRQHAHTALGPRPIGTFTASTPAALSARHCSSIGAGSTPRGGTISTLVTSSPRASFAPQHERSDNGTSSTPAGDVIVSRDTTAG